MKFTIHFYQEQFDGAIRLNLLSEFQFQLAVLIITESESLRESWLAKSLHYLRRDRAAINFYVLIFGEDEEPPTSKFHALEVNGVSVS